MKLIILSSFFSFEIFGRENNKQAKPNMYLSFSLPTLQKIWGIKADFPNLFSDIKNYYKFQSLYGDDTHPNSSNLSIWEFWLLKYVDYSKNNISHLFPIYRNL